MDESAYFRVEHDAARGLVRIIRTATPMPGSLAEIRAAFAGVQPRVAQLAGARALLDLRAGPGRNDADFEAASRELRQSILSQFSRVAILVRSAAGKLQVKRLSEGEGAVFLDEAEALRYLTQP